MRDRSRREEEPIAGRLSNLTSAAQGHSPLRCCNRAWRRLPCYGNRIADGTGRRRDGTCGRGIACVCGEA